MNPTKTSPTKVTQGETCKGCSWLVRGAEQPKGVFEWGCRFYHKGISIIKPYPLRPTYCNIDGRKEQAKYDATHKKPTENNPTEEQS